MVQDVNVDGGYINADVELYPTRRYAWIQFAAAALIDLAPEAAAETADDLLRRYDARVADGRLGYWPAAGEASKQEEGS